MTDDLISREAALDALSMAAWKHDGDDAYSAGMEDGARNQSQADHDAIRALPAAQVTVQVAGDDLLTRMQEWWEYDHGHLIGQAAARIRQLEAAQVTLAEAARGTDIWRPIGTAPRDKTWFIARSATGQIRFVHFDDAYDRFPISHDDVIWATEPTEWTPLQSALRAIAGSDNHRGNTEGEA